MSKTTISEEKNNTVYPDAISEGLVEEMADELVEEDEVEEPAIAEIQEAAEEVGGADLVDTYLKSVGRYPMLKIDEEQQYVRMLEGGNHEQCTQAAPAAAHRHAGRLRLGRGRVR